MSLEVAGGRELIGRDAEVQAVLATLKRSDLAGVLVSGEPGTGKTHLLDVALDLAGHAGFTVVRITGTRALSDLPLAAFAPFLPGRPSGDAGDLLTLRDALVGSTGGRPLILGVDDAHLLDDASAAVVHQLAAELTAFVVGTLRSGEVPPDAITALWKDRLVHRIELDPLDRVAVGALTVATLGAPASPDVEEQLWRRSRGNPMFVRELLLAASAQGVLRLEDGRLVRDGELPAPATVVELVAAQLAALDDDEQRAVGFLALAGSLDVDVLERLVPPPTLVRLEAARLVTAEEQGERLEVRFTHPLHADAVRQSMGRLVARQLRRELADELEAGGGAATDDVLRIVTLRLESGGTSSPELLRRATRLAARRSDHALAERLARTATAADPSLGAAIALARALVEQGRHEEAAAALADPSVDRDDADAADRTRAALLDATIQFWGLGHAEPALATLRAAHRQAPANLRDHLVAAAAAIEAARGRPDAALALAPPRSEAASTPLGAFAVLTALSAAGRPAAALAAVDLPTASTGQQALTGVAYAFTLVDAGRIEEAGRLALDRWEESNHAGDLHARVAWSTALGWVDLLQGRTAAARRWFEEAAQLAPCTAASLHGRRWSLGGAMFAATQLGDLEGARVLAARLDALPSHDAVVHELFGQRGRAWLRAGEGDVDGAVDLLFAMADAALADGRGGHVTRLLTDAARLDRPEPAAARLEAAELDLDGAFFPVLADSVRAFAAGDGAALADAGERLLAIGALVLAAESAAGAFALANETGEDARVVAARGRRAQELRAPLAHVATPGIAAAPTEIPLSRREREIAMLVAAGRTSREVAEELVIGVRTVESHLARVYDKLGVRSRADLADALGLELSA